jgi:hypothetical protein
MNSFTILIFVVLNIEENLSNNLHVAFHSEMRMRANESSSPAAGDGHGGAQPKGTNEK